MTVWGFFDGYQWVSMKMVPQGNNSWASVRISYELVIQILMLKIMILKDETLLNLLTIDVDDYNSDVIVDSDIDNEG